MIGWSLGRWEALVAILILGLSLYVLFRRRQTRTARRCQEEPATCPRCGQENRGEAVYCAQCGQKLAGAAQPVTRTRPKKEKGGSLAHGCLWVAFMVLVVMPLLGLLIYYRDHLQDAWRGGDVNSRAGVSGTTQGRVEQVEALATVLRRIPAQLMLAGTRSTPPQVGAVNLWLERELVGRTVRVKAGTGYDIIADSYGASATDILTVGGRNVLAAQIHVDRAPPGGFPHRGQVLIEGRVTKCAMQGGHWRDELQAWDERHIGRLDIGLEDCRVIE